MKPDSYESFLLVFDHFLHISIVWNSCAPITTTDGKVWIIYIPFSIFSLYTTGSVSHIASFCVLEYYIYHIGICLFRMVYCCSWIIGSYRTFCTILCECFRRIIYLWESNTKNISIHTSSKATPCGTILRYFCTQSVGKSRGVTEFFIKLIFPFWIISILQYSS